MRYCEIATITVPVGTTRSGSGLSDALGGIADFVNAEGAGGTLLGCWMSEFGPQNKILVMRGFESHEELFAERCRVLMSPEPFLPAARLASLKLEAFAQFPSLPPIQPGDPGPVYEFRTYVLKIGGLAPTLAAWEKGVPARAALSPLVTAMYALDGEPRFVHIWAYRNLEERRSIRAEAFRSGVWPATGAPEWLTSDLRSEVYMPTSISNLR